MHCSLPGPKHFPSPSLSIAPCAALSPVLGSILCYTFSLQTFPNLFPLSWGVDGSMVRILLCTLTSRVQSPEATWTGCSGPGTCNPIMPPLGGKRRQDLMELTSS